MTSFISTAKPIRKKCPVCGKKRIERLFKKGARSCELCKIAKAHGQKLERREASSRTWIKRLDKLVGGRVRSRGVCEAVGRPHKGVLQWAHIVSRSYHNTRWDEDNSLCLCAGCHKFYTDRPLEWENFVLEKGVYLGDIKIKALDHSRVIDFRELYNELKDKYEV